MSNFDELVAMLRDNAGEGADLSPYDELTSSYVSMTEGAAAAAAEKDAAIADLTSQVQALKAQNYELLMQVSASTAPVVDETEPDDEPDDDEEGYDNVDDLFGEDED